MLLILQESNSKSFTQITWLPVSWHHLYTEWQNPCNWCMWVFPCFEMEPKVCICITSDCMRRFEIWITYEHLSENNIVIPVIFPNLPTIVVLHSLVNYIILLLSFRNQHNFDHDFKKSTLFTFLSLIQKLQSLSAEEGYHSIVLWLIVVSYWQTSRIWKCAQTTPWLPFKVQKT